MRAPPLLLAVLAATVVLAGCADAPGRGPAATGGGAPTDGYAVETVVEGLEGPTQVVDGPDGRLWVAHLAGPEGAGRGQVVAVARAGGGAPEVLLDGLAKPTGLAVSDGAVWVVLERSVVRAPLDADGAVTGPVETVLDDLPSNGRSNGTLSVAPDGRLWFDTSGALAGDAPAEGSATLWALDPTDPRDPEPVATGYKHAYAHAFADDGTAWTTEVGDGRYDGEPMPDAVHVVAPATDQGWPRCVGDRRPVTEHGGSEAGCAEVPRPVALFPAGATPTGLVVAPWDADTLLVALWVTGEVVAVPASADPDARPAEPKVLVAGLDGPQHLLVDGDGVLVTEHRTGRIVRLSRVAG